MKNLKFLQMMILLVSLCSCDSCKDEEWTALPPKTQTGANTFGCYVNGNIFLANTTLFGYVRPVTAIYYAEIGYVCIQGCNAHYGTSKVAGDIAIQIHNVFDCGDYSLKYENCDNFHDCDHTWYDYALDKPIDGDFYMHYMAETGMLTITKLDTINQIISGIFWFTGKNKDGENIKITDGRFDIKLNEYP